jgi:hypothetical protein
MSGSILPWERQENEPDRWFDRFDRFARTLGYEFSAKRSFWLWCQKNVDRSEVSDFGLWREMAVKYDWEARAKDWSDHDRSNLKEKWDSRRRELLDEDWDVGKKLRQTAIDFIEAFETMKEVQRTTTENDEGVVTETIVLAANFTAGDLARIAKVGSELQRLGVGEPTQIQGTAQPGVGIYLPRIDNGQDTSK